MAFQLPARRKGRQSQESTEHYQHQVIEFCQIIKKIRSRSDFSFSSRGWCYALESEIGLLKSEFDQAQLLINECRKNGMLPVNIAASDESREFSCIESVDSRTPTQEAEDLVDYIVNYAGLNYTQFSFWENQEYYIQMLVEKIDLRKLFEPICRTYRIPIANAKGWPDINMRAEMMRRFKYWEVEGKKPVLLYCGDFDPAGLHISDNYREMFAELSEAVGWSPDNLIIDRFGLNYEFIQEAGLSWIENLITGNKDGKDLSDPKHTDHNKVYVQEYIKKYGARKCEANAIVVAPEMGQRLCREAIAKYISEDALDEYSAVISSGRQAVLNQVNILLSERFSNDSN